MNRMPSIALRLTAAALLLPFGVSRMHAQEQKPATQAPAEQSADDDDDKDNPFLPEPAPSLPPGMTGSNANDPRAKLSPGLYDAGETAMGLKHLMLAKKPDAFQLGASDPDDPKVQKVIGQ